MKDVIIKCEKGEVKKTLAYIKCEGAFCTLCYIFDIEALEKV